MRVGSLRSVSQNHFRKSDIFLQIGLYLCLIFIPETGNALPRLLQVQVDKVWIDESAPIHDITASFPYYVMSRVKVYDENQHYVPRLASTDRWLSLYDKAENGEWVGNVWRTALEYHVENTAIPQDPDVKKQLDYFGVTETRMYDYDLSIMLVMDYSRSMDDIHIVEQATLDLVKESAGRDPIGVIKFSDEVKICQPITQNTSMLEAAISDSSVIRIGTSLYGAIDEAINHLKVRSGRRVVLVYTDGKNDYNMFINPLTLQEVIDHANQQQVELFVIGLGGGIDENILKQLASESKGKYYYGQEPQRLEPIFLKIYGDLRGYYIMRHMSTDPFNNGTWRWVEIEVVDIWKGGTGYGKYKVPYFPSDVRVFKSVTTDSVIQHPYEPKYYAMASDTVTYSIQIENKGKGAYSVMDIVDVLNDSLFALSKDMLFSGDVTLKSMEDHRVAWQIPRLDAKTSVQIKYKAKLDSVMPIDPLSLMNKVQLFGDSVFTIKTDEATVLGYGQPDFSVQCISPAFFASPYQDVEIQANIINHGNAHADRPFRISFEYQGQVLTYDTLQALNINQSALVRGHVSFPAWDDYPILVRADVDQAIQELDESNNTALCTLQVKLTDLDVQISDVNYRDTIRGVTGKFPSRLLTTVNVWDQNRFPVYGLSNASWSRLQDQTPAGVTVGGIWTSMHETYQDNPNYPIYSDVRTDLEATEFQNSTASWVLFVSTGNVTQNWFESVRPALLSLCSRLKTGDRVAIMAADQSTQIIQPFTGNKNLLMEGVNDLSDGTMLHLWDDLLSAIDLAATLSGRNGVMAIVGGDDQGSSAGMTQVSQYAQQFGVPLYMISLQNHVSQDSLQKLALTSGGTSWQFNETASLRLAVEDAERLLRNYYVLRHISSDTLKNLSWRQLALDIDAYGFTTNDTGLYQAPKGIHDASVQKLLYSRDYIVQNGDTLWTGQPGDSAWCMITIANQGDFPLKTINVEDSLPGNLIPQSPDFAIYNPVSKRLQWVVDSLKVGETVEFSYACFIDTLSQLLEQDLISHIHISSSEDEAPWNDSDHDTLRYIPLMAADISIRKWAEGDSSSIINGVTNWFVHPQGIITYQISIQNMGEMPAKSITVKDALPQFVDWIYSTRPFSDVSDDTLYWQISRLNGYGALLSWKYTCKVDSLMPPWDVPLVNSVSVYSEDDLNPDNNTDCDSVTAVGIAPPWPLIEAAPNLIYPMDSVQVRVLCPFSAQSWDIQIIFGDGSVDHTYADAFIAATPLTPNHWLNLEPVFTATEKRTEQEEESIRIIFKTSDLWGVSRNDTASIIVTLPDLVVHKDVKTDFYQVVNNDTLWYADHGESVIYTVTLTNRGKLPCHDILINDFLPLDLKFIKFEKPTSYTIQGSTLSWQLSGLNGFNDQMAYSYSCQVKSPMPPWIEEEINKVTAVCDRDGNPDNNMDQTIVYAIGEIPPDPVVLVHPIQSEPGDSIEVQVVSPIVIAPGQWHLSVIYEDGSIKEDYAWDFIMRHGLISGDTLQIIPAFDDTRMRNNNREEQISFVLETIDDWQASYFDTAYVHLKSGDEFWLDRNIMRGDQQNVLGISFRMSTNRHAKIMIYDIAGSFVKTVADGLYLAGWNQVYWDGRNKQDHQVGSGIYVALYTSGDVKKAHKFIVVR